MPTNCFTSRFANRSAPAMNFTSEFCPREFPANHRSMHNVRAVLLMAILSNELRLGLRRLRLLGLRHHIAHIAEQRL